MRVQSEKLLWSSESSGMYCRVLNWMSTDVSEVCAASVRAMMEAARTSETTVDIQLRTWQYIPADSWASYSPPWELEISSLWLSLIYCKTRCGCTIYSSFLPVSNEQLVHVTTPQCGHFIWEAVRWLGTVLSLQVSARVPPVCLLTRRKTAGAEENGLPTTHSPSKWLLLQPAVTQGLPWKVGQENPLLRLLCSQTPNTGPSSVSELLELL
jgi:hypothetical protein